MPFTITAEFVLGTYRGHGEDGRPEMLPSVARLHAALLCAAGFGPRAEYRNDDLAPNQTDEAALRWLENNPPDAVSIPSMRVNARADAVAYRDDGTLKRAKGTAIIKRLPKTTSSVAVDGCFSWTWSRTPPADVVGAFEALCPDVPHLGNTEAPVRLTCHHAAVDPTHTHDANAELFSSGEDIELPKHGRLDELLAAHAHTRGREPTRRQDATSADEKSTSPAPPRTALELAKYVPVDKPPDDAPWPEVVMVPLDKRIAERDRVRWAVAAHRALIRSIGYGAPPLLTGAYPKDIPRPANRLALHFIDASVAGRVSGFPDEAESVLLALLPRDADPGDLGTVLQALRDLPSIRGPKGVLARVVGTAQVRRADRFWPEKSPGTVRLWRTSPPAVPDTRGNGRSWTFVDAALLSLGFVWQGSTMLPTVSGRGDARCHALAAAVADAGVAVVSANPVRSSDVRNYAHRVNEHAVVRPYRTVLALGTLGGECLLQALGQSRHLGGGLLVPVDLPEGAALDDAARAAGSAS